MFDWLRSLFRRRTAPVLAAAAAAPLKPVPVRRALCGPKALALILEFEGLDQPHRRPPGQSGITIGHGFDLGYCTEAEFLEAWQRHLEPAHTKALLRAIGKQGPAAEQIEGMFRGITITKAMAMEVFERCTLPKWTAAAAKVYPGIQVLNPDQQGVLVSLVFNRGAALDGPRRREMKAIQEILTRPHSAAIKARAIAEQILAMQRLWPDIPGLQRRRRAEAALMLANS